MDVSVEIGQGGTVLSESADPSNQAGLHARQEYARILSDPQHPMYEGFKRGEKSVMDHIDKIYRDAYPQTTALDTRTDSAPLRVQAPDPALSLEDRAAQTQVEEMLRSTFGDNFDSEMADMRVASQHLFATPDGVKVLETLSPLITDLGPLAQVRSIRFLAELGQLIKTQGRTR